MNDRARAAAVWNLAYELAEAVRAENVSRGFARESEAWRDGIETLMAAFPTMTEDEADRALERGMVDSAM